MAIVNSADLATVAAPFLDADLLVLTRGGIAKKCTLASFLGNLTSDVITTKNLGVLVRNNPGDVDISGLENAIFRVVSDGSTGNTVSGFQGEVTAYFSIANNNQLTVNSTGKAMVFADGTSHDNSITAGEGSFLATKLAGASHHNTIETAENAFYWVYSNNSNTNQIQTGFGSTFGASAINSSNNSISLEHGAAFLGDLLGVSGLTVSVGQGAWLGGQFTSADNGETYNVPDSEFWYHGKLFLDTSDTAPISVRTPNGTQVYLHFANPIAGVSAITCTTTP